MRDRTRLVWDHDGRPKTAATETYTYDGFGKRVLIGVPSASTQDIFDPASGRLLVENNAGAQPQRTYVYLNGIPIALVSGFSSISYVLSDQLGQPQKLVDGFATLVWDRVSDPFGLTSSQAKGISTAISLRFPGQEYDAITGLHYNDQRDYDPTLGRYIQPDPIGLAGGINTYAYAAQNPIANSDESGLQVIVVTPPPPLPGVSGGGSVSGAPTIYSQSPTWFNDLINDLAQIPDYLGTTHFPGYFARQRGKSDPVSDLPVVNPGRDCDDNCKPCPPDIIWSASGDAHGSTGGVHYHGIHYNQDPDCNCHPKRVSGPDVSNLE